MTDYAKLGKTRPKGLLDPKNYTQYNSKGNKHFIWMRVLDYLHLFC